MVLPFLLPILPAWEHQSGVRPVGLPAFSAEPWYTPRLNLFEMNLNWNTRKCQRTKGSIIVSMFSHWNLMDLPIYQVPHLVQSLLYYKSIWTTVCILYYYVLRFFLQTLPLRTKRMAELQAHKLFGIISRSDIIRAYFKAHKWLNSVVKHLPYRNIFIRCQVWLVLKW